MRIQTLVLTPKLFEQVDQTIKALEFRNGVVRESVNCQKGNRFGMKGNTYTISYGNVGRWSVFQKEMSSLWVEINRAHPETVWRGK